MVANTNHRVVIDASAILSYILPDEVTPKNVMNVFRKYSRDEVILLAPTLLNYEIGNALKSAVKQKRLNQISATEIIEGFKQLEIAFIDPNIVETINLSISKNISFYDASYLCIAKEQSAKLLTLDKKLHECLTTK